MRVRLVNSAWFELGAGANTSVLLAEEIYSVLFEGKETIRTLPVTKEDFLALNVHFSNFAADPVIVIQTEPGPAEPTIFCRLIAREGNTEAPVSMGPAGLLDYAIGNAHWMPLPPGTLDEVQLFLAATGLAGFGPISLAQYMTLLRQKSSGLTLEDRTDNALSASALAPSLKGAAPSAFIGKLYPYQLDGYLWLSYMSHNGLGCIIADEMGLGKTIQVICLMIDAAGKTCGPNLVVSPATLLENWRREIARFGPGLRVLSHSGSRRTGFPADLRNYDVVICSYETAVADVSLFRNVPWNLLVVDEAQGIKNPAAKRTVQLKTIPRACAVAMTGTPVENRLTDLWSITDFVLPSLLGSLPEFERRHPDTIAGAELLEPIVSPLMLRRTVKQVANDLPARIDIPQLLQLDEESAQAYEAIREAAAGSGAAFDLSALIHLRMFCAHPWLTGQFQHVSDARSCSPKFSRLLEVLEEIIAAGGKAIIFTSFQRSIDLIVSEVASAFGIHTDYIDGRVPVPQRQEKVDAFTNHKSSAVLVLNPRAAGTGLNITAANHVIHYNLEWNPAVEDQASARSYRRGQTRPVTVHRFFYASTVEEVINDRMQRKRDLASAAVVGTDGRQQEVEDILRALRISPVSQQQRTANQ